ncbi:pheromone receptor Rcb2 B44 [Mycena latifolia]|nr:pheromone receptor Rcb2 B44 [Mycena latifolia]
MSFPYAYPVFPIFAFFGFVLSLIPLPWHLQAWNSGTCYFMLWTALACLNQFINSIVWAQYISNFAPWWCEISIRIILGASVGIPASSLCIVRRLYTIASVQSVSISRAEKRRAVLIDSLICVLFPLLYIAMQYIVQGHRFDIFQEIGCYPAIYNTLPAYFISFAWPILLGLISLVYCILALRAFNRRRIQFNQFLNSGSSLTVSRYFRLMALAMTEMLCTTPIAIFVVYLNATATEIGPWRSWADTHFMYSRVGQVPSFLWSSQPGTVIAFELTRWAAPFCAFVFFAFFGFAQEARRHYRLAYEGALRRVGLARFLPTSTTSTASSMPRYEPPKAAAIPLRPARTASIVSLTSTAGYPESSAYSLDRKAEALEYPPSPTTALEYPPSPSTACALTPSTATAVSPPPAPPPAPAMEPPPALAPAPVPPRRFSV